MKGFPDVNRSADDRRGEERTGNAPRHPSLTLATCILASSLSFVNVGLVALDRDLGSGTAGLQWVINGYLLPLKIARISSEMAR